MSLWRSLRAGARSLVRRREVERDFEDELRHYIAQETEANVRSGMTPAAAARAARAQVGSIEATAARVRAAGWEAGIETAWYDLGHAARALLRAPAFTALAMITLALGIGANTAMFSVINAVILRPLPYHEAGALALIWTNDVRRGLPREGTAYRTIVDWHEQTRAFDDVAYFTTQRVSPVIDGERGRARSALVSGNLFGVLGIAAEHGRAIAPDDESRQAPVIVISHAFWQRAFGGALDVVGRTLLLDDGSKGGMSGVTVVGIMPAGFYFPDDQTDLWTPATTYWRFGRESTERFAQWARRWTALGRLSPDASLDDARTDLARIGSRLEAAEPSPIPDFPGFGATVLPVLDSIAGAGLQSALWLLLGAVGIVLLVACSNIANLLLARGAVRQQEFAVRRALGAGRGRLVRQLTVESLVLALAGGAAGLAVAAWSTRVLSRAASAFLPRVDEIVLDARVLLFATSLSLAAGLLFGIIPALRLSGGNANDVLREGGRGTGGVRLRRGRGTLVMIECSLAIVLLAGAGLLLRSLQRLHAIDPGFDPRNVLVVRLEFPSEAPAPNARSALPLTGAARARTRAQQMEAITERLRAMPGVQAVGLVDDLFIGGSGNESIVIAGRPDLVTTGELYEGAATPGFFAAFGVPLRRGRYLARNDAAQKIMAMWSAPGSGDQPPESRNASGTERSLAAQSVAAVAAPVVVNEEFVRRYFPGEDAIGKRFCVDPMNKTFWYEIVGVIGDAHRQGLDRTAIPEYTSAYFPSPNGRADLLVRTAANPLTLSPAIRAELKRALPDVVVASVSTVESQLGDFSALRRLQTGLLTAFAALALVLAAVGIFGLVHYTVGERTREIGVRVALGARPRDVLVMVLAQGMRMPVIGIAIGLAAAAGLTRVMAHLLFDIGAHDPATYLAVAALLSLIALAACLVAARRALRLDPLRALRA